MRKHSKYNLAIHIILIKDEEVLLLRRYNTGYEDGKYSLIAGHVEEGESIIEAGIREAKEEVGIDITPVNFQMCGSMHRKSDDERIDYFAIVNKWENEIQNREHEKCDNLLWVHKDQLPNNTIPYIRTAINKTLSAKGIFWYEEFGWNTYRDLENERSKYILTTRGIINESKTYSDVLEYIINTISTIDKYLEKGEDNSTWKNLLSNSLQDQRILIGTPILRNLNEKSDCGLSACSIIDPPTNSHGKILYQKLESILESQLKMGIGIGIDLSLVQYPDNAVSKIDDILYRIDTKLIKENKRPAAVILTLKDSHPRIKEFIKCRDKKDFNKTKLNISVFIDDGKTVFPIVSDIAHAISLSGEPSVLFSERLNKDNDTPQWQYRCTAPCAEIAMAENDACHFSYLNLAAFVVNNNGQTIFSYDDFITNIHLIVRFLDDIVEYSLEHCTKNEYELVNKKRRIGVGIAGFATALVKLGIPYNSFEGKKFAEKVTKLLVLHTKLESIQLAQRRGRFVAFEQSRYSEKEWLEEKLFILDDCKNELINKILTIGLRNATTVAFPPTGTTSQIATVSPSFEPYIDFAVTYNSHKFIPKVLCDHIYKIYPKSEADILISQLLRKEVDMHRYKEFVTATQIDVETQLEYTKIFQDASDGSASKTINVPSSTTKKQIEEYLLKAQQLGLKGISFFRENCFKSYHDEC